MPFAQFAPNTISPATATLIDENGIIKIDDRLYKQRRNINGVAILTAPILSMENKSGEKNTPADIKAIQHSLHRIGLIDDDSKNLEVGYQPIELSKGWFFDWHTISPENTEVLLARDRDRLQIECDNFTYFPPTEFGKKRAVSTNAPLVHITAEQLYNNAQVRKDFFPIYRLPPNERDRYIVAFAQHNLSPEREAFMRPGPSVLAALNEDNQQSLSEKAKFLPTLAR